MPGILGIIHFDATPVPPELPTHMARSAPWRGAHRIHRLSPSLVFSAQDTPRNSNGFHAGRLLAHDTTRDIVVIADGRLHGSDELLDRLPADDRTGAGDAALILRSYLQWGTRCLDRLHGEFAFALWDGRSQTVFCARDIFGVRPLYFARHGARFYFASDMTPLLCAAGASTEPDELGIADQLLNVCADPARTTLRHVKRLPNGHSVLVRHDGEQAWRYWRPEDLPGLDYTNPEDYPEHFRQLLAAAVRDRQRPPGVCTGLLMSGGLDSTSIAVTASRLHEETGGSLYTASALFPSYPACDESRPLAEMEQCLDIHAAYLNAEEHPLLEPLDRDPAPIELPFRFGHRLLQALFELLGARGVDLILTGNGGDTLMSGSRMVYLDQAMSGDPGSIMALRREAHAAGRSFGGLLWQWMLKPLLPAKTRLFARRIWRHDNRHLPAWITRSFSESCDLPDRLYLNPLTLPPMPRARRAILSTLLQPGLEHSQRTMDHHAALAGVEVSHPYLDRRLAEFVAAIPPGQLRSQGMTKCLTRHAMGHALPRMVVERRDKTGFTPYVHDRLRTSLEPAIVNILENSRLDAMGIIDKQAAMTAYQGFSRHGAAMEVNRFWAMISLENWLASLDRPLGAPAAAGGDPASSAGLGYNNAA